MPDDFKPRDKQDRHFPRTTQAPRKLSEDTFEALARVLEMDTDTNKRHFVEFFRQHMPELFRGSESESKVWIVSVDVQSDGEINFDFPPDGGRLTNALIKYQDGTDASGVWTVTYKRDGSTTSLPMQGNSENVGTVVVADYDDTSGTVMLIGEYE